MRLGIDASNIRAGGGITHLVELLNAATPEEQGFNQVVIWAGTATLRHLPERPWLRKAHDPLLDRRLPFRLYWQRFKLDRLARSAGCDVLFVPGGTYSGSFRPYVTMSQNALPFEWTEARRYGPSWMLLKLLLLRQSQGKTLQQADGVIFLTDYAHKLVVQAVKQIEGLTSTVPHGVDENFDCPPRPQHQLTKYSVQNPVRILYVSIVTVYKHQWQVAEAVAMLRKEGFPVQLELIGPAYPPAMARLRNTMQRLDPNGEFIHYRGAVPYTELHREYKSADIFVYASSCENLPNIVLEAMRAGLPIACSQRGPMPEVLADAGVYLDPEKPVEIASAIRSLLEDPTLRHQKAGEAYERSHNFTWERCADETLDFIARVVNNNHINR